MTSKHNCSKSASAKIDAMALGMVPGVGSQTFRALIAHFGSATQVWAAEKSALQKVAGIGPTICQHLVNSHYFISLAHQEWEQATKKGIDIYILSEDNYPHRLRQIPDAPPVLFAYGPADLNPTYTVAIVGTRKATAYGKSFLDDFFQDIAPYHPTVVSGLAYGIDIYAHQLALDYELPTIGVMASGMNIIYPREHRAVAKEMVRQQGALLTESPLGIQPEAMLFPARNRIIAGMVDVVLVIEAMSSGGALITADLANQYDREVMALTGPYQASKSEGCHQLIKSNKAHLMTDAEDLIQLMSWETQEEQKEKHVKMPDNLTLLEKEVFSFISEKTTPVVIDELKLNFSHQLPLLSSSLLNLELVGLIQKLPGGVFGAKGRVR